MFYSLLEQLTYSRTGIYVGYWADEKGIDWSWIMWVNGHVSDPKIAEQTLLMIR